MTWKQLALLAIVAPVVATLIGCGEGGPKSVPVTGTVLVDDKPVADLLVTFVPKDAKTGRPATGRTDDSGAFTLTTNRLNDGALVGDYTVLINDANDAGGNVAANAVIPKPNDPGYRDLQLKLQAGKAANAQGLRIARDYGDPAKTNLTATVKPTAADNKFKFTASSKTGQ